MNSDMEQAPNRAGLAYAVGILATFLIVAFLVSVLKHHNQPAPLGKDRAVARAKTLAELRMAEAEAINNIGWVDQGKGIVRLRVADAMKIVLKEAQTPGLTRSNLSVRVDKATAVPPAAPPKPSPFE